MRKRKASPASEADRQQMESRRARRERARAARREAAAREASLRAALARRPLSAAQVAVERVLAAPQAHASKYRDLLRAVADHAPRLIDDDTLAALARMADAAWVRPVSTWTPAGRGRDTLFRSLAKHLFARFPMPAVLWTAFRAGEAAPILVPVAVRVAAGGSLYDAVLSEAMPVPLTRRMCHEVLGYRGELSFLAAIRRTQVRAAGGTLGLCQTWTQTRVGRRLYDRRGEEFWQSVLAWLCRNAALPNADVSPVLDYIEHRREEEPDFAMKGRTVAALVRGMREWHRELVRERVIHGVRFEPSGFEPMTLDRSRRDSFGKSIKEIWRVREVLDSRTLLDEGRVMSHCVYSYARRIQKGECSIWTLTLEDDTGHWRRLTIEVRPSLRFVAQARGRFNALPEARDMIALNTWAGRNNLMLAAAAL